MIAATIFSLLFVPTFFVLFGGISDFFGKSTKPNSDTLHTDDTSKRPKKRDKPSG